MPDRRRLLGQSSEALAAAFLRLSGYRIVQLNYRTPLGEIDIIATEGKVLVFVEVKARRSTRRGSPKAAVTPAKRRKISMVALTYLKSNGQADRSGRFDVVSIQYAAGGPPRIEIVKNAFELAYP
jgi:putative endonuclease